MENIENSIIQHTWLIMKIPHAIQLENNVERPEKQKRPQRENKPLFGGVMKRNFLFKRKFKRNFSKNYFQKASSMEFQNMGRDNINSVF